jgi:Na+/H+ antiporter NhaA
MALITDAKLGIIFASALAGAIGFLILRMVYPPIPDEAGD